MRTKNRKTEILGNLFGSKSSLSNVHMYMVKPVIRAIGTGCIQNKLNYENKIEILILIKLQFYQKPILTFYSTYGQYHEI